MSLQIGPDDQDLSGRVADVLPRERGLYWAGKWHEPTGVDSLTSHNPSTGEPLAKVLVGGSNEINAAVAAARQAFPAWAATPPLIRARALRDAAARIREHADELALIDAADCGNPVKAMRFDAEIAATQLEYFAGLVLEIKGETLPTPNGSLNYTLREPLGVVGRIYPFNHPFMFAAGKIAAPLAAGNTVVIKPPEQAPLSSIRLLELLHDLFPPGVLNGVVGGRDAGAALAAHKDVAAIGLIGSVPAGQSVARAAAETLKPALLELGGKNAMVVYPDADFDAAVDGAIRGMNFTWCGQSCGSTSRLFVHETLYDRFLEALAERMPQRHKPGIATHMSTTMGAMINRQQYERSLAFIASAREEGARVVCGGAHPDDPALARGFFIEPTVFADVTPDMRIAREEIFGPVLSVLRWRDEDTMFEQVNALEFGLTGSIWTENITTAHRAAQRIQSGYIWINECSIHIPGAPFGGYKMSGVGREESREELLEFTRLKNVNLALRR